MRAIPPSSRPDPDGTVERYRLHAPAYDAATSLFDSVRRRAVRLLSLSPGDVVLDVGCGTGRCFAAIEERIGDGGRLVGVDASPDMLAVARTLVGQRGWPNVTLVESDVASADLPRGADAILFCAAHDVLQRPEALAHVLLHLRPGGRVVAAGGKWASPWLVGLNVAVALVHGPYVRSLEGFERPWTELEPFLDEARVRSVGLGSGYLVTGTHRMWAARQEALARDAARRTRARGTPGARRPAGSG